MVQIKPLVQNTKIGFLGVLAAVTLGTGNSDQEIDSKMSDKNETEPFANLTTEIFMNCSFSLFQFKRAFQSKIYSILIRQ